MTGATASTWAILVAAGSGERLGADRPEGVRRARRPRSARREPGAAGRERRGSMPSSSPSLPTGRRRRSCWPRSSSRRRSPLSSRAARHGPSRFAPRLAEVPDDALVVIVHDAARPLVDDAVIERVLRPLAEGYDGVVPGLPLADTVKRVERRSSSPRPSTARRSSPCRRRRRSPRPRSAPPTRRATRSTRRTAHRSSRPAGGRIRVVDG